MTLNGRSSHSETGLYCFD